MSTFFKLHYTRLFAPMAELYSVFITAAVRTGDLKLDAENTFSWSGECHRCMAVLANSFDAGFCDSLVDIKSRAPRPPKLQYVQWRFVPANDELWWGNGSNRSNLDSEAESEDDHE